MQVIGLRARLDWGRGMTVEVGKFSHSLMRAAGLDPELKSDLTGNHTLFNVFDCMGEVVEEKAGKPGFFPTHTLLMDDVDHMWHNKSYWLTEAETKGGSPPSNPARRFIGRRMLVLRESEDLVISMGRVYKSAEEWNIQALHGQLYLCTAVQGEIQETRLEGREFHVGASKVSDIFEKNIWLMPESLNNSAAPAKI